MKFRRRFEPSIARILFNANDSICRIRSIVKFISLPISSRLCFSSPQSPKCIISTLRSRAESLLSSELFEPSESLVIDNDYKNKAERNDYCFVEDKGYDLSYVDEIILCLWNRRYPSDQFFDIDIKGNSFKKVSTENIVGSSHDKITIETYKKG